MGRGDSYEGADRRGARRYRVKFQAHWEGKASKRKGTITDLSKGGCFLLTEDLVQPGELVMIELGLPAGGIITIWGNVAYTAKEIGFGVRFSPFMVDADRRRLEWLIRAEALRESSGGKE